MVKLVASPESATVLVGDVAVGTYVLNDPFKPYLHPLRTPAGHTVSLAIPHDHRHHKGLMYSLATYDVNFWEEVGDEDHPRIGRQRQDSIDFDFSSERPAIHQSLTWVDDVDSPVFQESRTIVCEQLDERTIRWTWRTRLEALRDECLRMSQWSEPDKGGRRINYHGLGLRFPRSFSGTSDTEVFTEDGPAAFEDVLGMAASLAGVRGQVDGAWPAPMVAVSIRQLEVQHEFFALREPFVYLSVGPSAVGPVTLTAGDVITAGYWIDVSDQPRP